MMKKSLIALAAATVAGAAFAQSAVTISGVVDIGYGQVDATGTASDQQRVMQNGSVTSSIAISGSEDIGGGLRGIFRYEMNPDFVAGTGLAGHPAGANGFNFVGLTGNFGEVRLGRLNSAFLQNWGIASPFGTALGSGWGPSGVVTRYATPGALTVTGTPVSAVALNAPGAATAPTRFNGAIEYQSPVFNGIQARLMYVPERDDGTAAVNRPSVVDAGLRFAQGPVTAMLSWQRTDASGAVANTAHPQNITSTTGAEGTLWMIGGRYTMGALAFSGGYWQEQVDIDNVERADITGWTLAVRYTMGAWAFTGAYTQSEDDAIAADQIFTVAGTGAKRSVVGLGADYSFSKRTALYGRFEGRDMGPTEVQTIHVGIRHTF